jgi:hypothetical protein
MHPSHIPKVTAEYDRVFAAMNANNNVNNPSQSPSSSLLHHHSAHPNVISQSNGYVRVRPHI